MATGNRRTKTALVLASGGVAGVSYEVGALRALDDILVGKTVNDFDIYVGTSAGAVVAASLASGVPPFLLASLIAGTNPRFSAMGRTRLYRPNIGEALERLAQAPGLIAAAAREYWRFRDRMPLSEAIYSLAPLLPSGIFDNRGLESYMRETFGSGGLSDDFRDIPKELHIIAADIETDERVAFSKYTFPDVPISKAVAASACIPILFRPVEIEGRHYVDGGIKGQAAIDVAIKRGANLIVVVNGLVPLDARTIKKHATADTVRKSIYELGIRAIANQVIRGMLHDSLVDHLKATRERHPDVDIILIEPRPDDEKMFFHEVMSFSARLMVLQHGYESVAEGLNQTWTYLKRILPPHGIEITRRVVDRKRTKLPVADIDERRQLLGRLGQTVLDRRAGTRTTTTRRKAASASGGNEPRTTRSRGTFKPRVISSE